MKNRIYFRNDQKKLPSDKYLRGAVRSAVNAALDFEGFEYPAEVSVTFTDNDGIRELNRDYRGKDAPTDVLSFPMLDDDDFGEGDGDGERILLGDIVISLERALEQSKDTPHTDTPDGRDPYLDEVSFLCIHSVLHLLGYDHETSEEDEKTMFSRQDEIMKILRESNN